MANRKINELVTRTPSLTDLILVGDPSSGYSYKATVTALADIIQTDIADAYVTIDTTQTVTGAKTFSNVITATSVANTPTDPDKFLTLNASNQLTYRTGTQVLSDIGGADDSLVVHKAGDETITGIKTFTPRAKFDGSINLKQGSGASIDSGYSAISTDANTFYFHKSGSIFASLNVVGLTASRTYTLQDANGTLAFTSDLSSYVPTTRTISTASPLQGGGDLSANRTISITEASTTTDGYLSAANFTTFNNKIGGSGTTNYIPKFTSSSAIGNSSIYDNSGNIGVGTIAATAKFEVSGGLDGTYNSNILINSSASTAKIAFNPSGSSSVGIGGGSNSLIFYADGANTERMRLTSTGLGIGTSSPDTKFQVQDGFISTYHNVNVNDAGYGIQFYTNGGGSRNTIATISPSQVGTARSANLLFATSNAGAPTTKMTLDASGNLGLGVTPSAWSAFKPSLQIGTASLSQIANRAYLTANGFYNGTAWTYIATDFASQYFQQNGTHIWNIAASGTAGNAISFTQAMTLDASGRLGLGSTTTTGGRLVITQNNSVQPAIYLPTDESTIQGPSSNTQIKMGGNLTIAAASTMPFLTNGSERMRITSGGNVGIGSSSPGYKLEVNGDIGFSGGASLKWGGNTYIYGENNVQIQAVVNGNTGWFVNSSGRVGIGTTSPTEKLEVNGNIKTAAPSGGTAKPWKLGNVMSSGVTENNEYLIVEVDGVQYNLRTCTPN